MHGILLPTLFLAPGIMEQCSKSSSGVWGRVVAHFQKLNEHGSPYKWPCAPLPPATNAKPLADLKPIPCDKT